MVYQTHCALPVRSYPLQGLPLFSLPGCRGIEYGPPKRKKYVYKDIDYIPSFQRKKGDGEILEIIEIILMSGRLD